MIRWGAGDVAKLLEHLTNMYKPWVQSLAPYESGMMMGGGDDDGDGIEEEDAATGASDHDSGDEHDDDSDCDQCSAWDKSHHVNELFHKASTQGLQVMFNSNKSYSEWSDLIQFKVV